MTVNKGLLSIVENTPNTKLLKSSVGERSQYIESRMGAEEF